METNKKLNSLIKENIDTRKI